eukprot:TRINITY_DN351_c0_g1_i2.p1 TRINITY_DN351_c0_g1~~TRINITY_DN351_c0_g1_i2.p1  ORF type:complete len:847 (-),score=321.11 TRINITY_DN351_c0_g1_i2:1134-3311(-)
MSLRAQRARDLIYSIGLPDSIIAEVLEAWEKLVEECGPTLSVAVRSSATAEDLPTASFAGQHDTFLNIRGHANLIDAVCRCFASVFTDRAICYRVDQGFDHFQVALSVGIQQMVRSDMASSGVMFTLDTETGYRDAVFITGAYGLGENVVQGTVDPDEFYVHKPTFELGHRAVLRHTLGEKAIKMVYAQRGKETCRNVDVSHAERARYCINDDEVLVLADAAIKVEKHYSKRAGKPRPMDLEWAKDGNTGLLYIVQARPETVASRREAQKLVEYVVKEKSEVLCTGRAVGTKLACGRARVIRNNAMLSQFKPGEVLVATSTTPDWEPVMKTAAAIVTDRGGRTCHAAIIARELGIPAVVGCGNAVEVLPDGIQVTVCCSEGDTGRVYTGEIKYDTIETDLSIVEKPRTHLNVNLGNPELAFQTSFLPVDGVGLARMEFIINEYIKIHPMALLHPERVNDPAVIQQINERTANFASPPDFFIKTLSEGVGTIAAAFYPRPVIVRMSDFKTNEYASLIGGKQFECQEENPMIGFRGASRYHHPNYAEGFRLECAAMLRVRKEMGLTNLKLMIPFCRRLTEARAVLDLMESLGLKRGEDGLEIYVMCEIPSNVILIDEFAKLFDGFSIGSNDLCQLTLGVDRDSEVVSSLFDERDPAVMKMIEMAIEGCKRNHVYSGICGQAPSDYPEIVRFLVEKGIESISVTPDTVVKTLMSIVAVEKELASASSS